MTVGTRSGVALLPEVLASPAAELVCSAVRSTAFELLSAIMVASEGSCRRARPRTVLAVGLQGVAHNPQRESLRSKVVSGSKTHLRLLQETLSQAVCTFSFRKLATVKDEKTLFKFCFREHVRISDFTKPGTQLRADTQFSHAAHLICCAFDFASDLS